jgi:pimeloyl-ACP methyl ester carboxylesterase
MRLYCLPGLGVDHRIYDRCDFGPLPITWLDWPTMPKGSTLADYAHALLPAINAREEHVLIGTSMGGMVAQELSLTTGPWRTIIISSWKGPQERPWLLDLLGRLRAERMVNDFFMKHFVPTVRVMRWKLGMEGGDATRHVQMMMERWSPRQLRTMIHACLSWKGVHATNVLHLHGDRDALMPVKLARGAKVIAGGTHLMVYTKAQEVSAAVRSEIMALR